MPTITPGNALYLYRLLSKSVGTGKQTMLARIEESLTAEDILPCDLRCKDVRELMEKLEFVRLSVFKRGRVYATIIAQPEWDELLEKAQSHGDKEPAKGGKRKSWKRKKGAKYLRPERPRPHGRPEPATEAEMTTATEAEAVVEAAEAEPAVKEASETEAEAMVEASEVAVEDVPAAEAGTALEEVPMEAEVPAAEAEPAVVVAPETEAEPVVEATEVRPAVAPAPARDTIKITVTYDPVPAQDHARDTIVRPAPSPKTRQETEPMLAPRDFAAEVWCPNSVLSTLYQLLPLDINPIELLAQDWSYAVSTEAYTLASPGIQFNLRCLRAPGSTPVQATISRHAPTASGRRWQLASIKGPVAGATFNFEGLPAQDEGAWSDLAGLPKGTYFHVSPLREFAQFATIGPWDVLLSQLATLAQPEPWGNDLLTLREYLAVTFHRLAFERKIATSADNLKASFDTGLLTPTSRRIFANFAANDKTIPWRLSGFSTQPSVTPAPDPAEYITALQHVVLAPPYTVRIASALTRSHKATDKIVNQSLARARRNHRVATPAYDPQTEELRLLLPYASEVPGMADNALVLAPIKEGGYEARALLSLERARVCARVITAELPSWLAPQTQP